MPNGKSPRTFASLRPISAVTESGSSEIFLSPAAVNFLTLARRLKIENEAAVSSPHGGPSALVNSQRLSRRPCQTSIEGH